MNKTQIKVLLIEDNPVDVIFLREALAQDALNSFDLTTVERLHSAIETLQKNTFDIILLDMDLPDSNGLKTFTQIHQTVPRIPKIVLSGLTDETVALQTVHIGAQDYIVKGTAGFAMAARAIRYAIERQRSREDLRASEERFRAIIEHGLDNISLLDAEGNLIWESPAVVRNLGYSENQFLGRNIFELMHPDDVGWTAELFSKLVQEPGTIQKGIFRLQHLSGSWRWVEAVVTNMLDNPSAQAIVVNYRDITERKQMETSLQASEARYRLATLATQDVIWEWNAHTSQVIWAENVQAVLGYSSAEIDPNVTWWEDHIHPEDRQQMLSQMNALMESGELVWSSEYRFQLKDGTYAYISDNGYVEREVNGKAIRAIGAMSDITERKQLDKKIQETSDQFRTLFEASPEAIMLIDPQKGWSILDCNATSCAMNGYTRDELIGQSVDIFNLTPGNPTERSEYLERVRRAGILRYETSHRRKDGTLFPIEVSTSLITLGGREMILGIDRDITERKRAEEALRESEALYRQAIEVAGAVPYRESYSDNGRTIKFEFIGDGIRQITGYGPDEFNSKLWDELAEEANLVEDLAGYSIDEGIERVRSGEYPIWKCEYRIRDRDGKIHWVFEAAVELRDEHGVSHGSIGTYQDITTRKQAEEKLLESEARFASIFHTNPTRVSITSFADGRFLDVNESFLESAGYSREEVIGHTSDSLNDWVDPQDRIRLRALLDEQGSVQNFETQLRRKSGNILDILISAELIELFGQRCILSVGLDITERKHAENELREKVADEALINRLNEAANSGENLGALIKMLDLEFQQHFSTTGLCLCLLSEDSKTLNMLEFSLPEDMIEKLEEVIGRQIPPIQISVHPNGIFEKLLEAQAGTITSDPQAIQQWMAEFEEAETTPGNSILDVQKLIPHIYELLGVKSIISLPLNSGGHTIGLLNITSTNLMTDHQLERFRKIASQLTAAILRKQDEQKLQESNERFRQLADNIQEVFWITDVTSGEDVYISPAAEKIWGHSMEDMMHVPDIFINSILSEDRPAVLKTIEEQRAGQRTEIEYRVKHSDGSIHWVWDRAFPIFDNSGMVVHMAGIAADITERKQAQDIFRQSERRLRQVIDLVPHFIFAKDVDGRFILANQAVADAYGTTVEALTNRLDADFAKSDEEVDQFRADDMDVINSGQSRFIPEEHITDANGRFRILSTTKIPFTFSGSPASAILGVSIDITERKQAEKESNRHLAEFEALYENGLAVSSLLKPREIGERIINTFEHHLAWHHVTIRLLKLETNNLEVVAFNIPNLNNEEARKQAEQNFNMHVQNVGQGISGWVVQTGAPIRTGNLQEHPRYVATYEGMQSGLYMPLKIGETTLGVISVESDEPNAFTEQDERLLATLANQAAVAFENARLYREIQDELSERRKVEGALRTSETHYRELADSITDIFFELNHDLLYSHWNKASEILTGVPANEAIGKSLREIFGESEEQTRIEKIYKNVLESHQPRTFETPFMVNAQLRSFEVNAYPSTQGVSVVAKDVTERKRSEMIMQKRFELMEYAAQHSLEEIMQMTIDEVNNLTGSTIGFFHTMETDQTTPALQIWPANTLSLFNVPISEGQHRSVDQAGVWAEAIRQRRSIIHNDYESLPNKKMLPPGHASIIREMVIPIIRSEKVLAVLGIANKTDSYTLQDLDTAERLADYAWDITERKQMEVTLAGERNQLAKRVEERTADLSRANSNLARALRVKDEFLANMSHELRTPLNAILGLSESLAEQTAGPLNDKQQKYITTVSESGHHLLSLINDILDLAKIEAGQITLDINRVDINSVCNASLRMIKEQAKKKNQEVTLEVDQSLGLMWADERRLKQMLVNLLSNAVKFTPEGGKLGLAVHGNYDENKMTFTIWDTGIGIKETDLPRLFQPFVQLDAGLARESSGTGLGLALVAQMARMHGGSASVVSQPGQGSHFSITLPWEPALAVDTIERLKTTGKFRPIKFDKDNKPTILLIEDTEEVIMMLSDYLELNGFKVFTARDGLEGVSQAQLHHPNLILMDIQMPRMDGFEATAKLRTEPAFQHTPIIALTALAMPNDRERCLAAGMDEYITKPVHLRGLVKIIEKFLGGEKEVKH